MTCVFARRRYRIVSTVRIRWYLRERTADAKDKQISQVGNTPQQVRGNRKTRPAGNQLVESQDKGAAGGLFVFVSVYLRCDPCCDILGRYV